MEKYKQLIIGRQNKPTMVNELTVGKNNLTSLEDIASGFNNEYFSNTGPDLTSKIDSTDCNFARICSPLHVYKN